MKILTAHNHYQMTGGDDRVAWETARLLEKKGHQIIPFSMKNENNWESEYSDFFVDEIDYGKIKPSFKNFKTAVKMIYSFEAKRKIEKLIKNTRPDIAHLHNIYGRLTPSILHSLKKYKIPALMTLHDYKLICPSYSMIYDGKVCERCKGGKFYQCVLTKCHKDSYIASLVYCLETYIHEWTRVYKNNINFFITPSQFMKDKMIEFGMPSEKVIHVPNFIELDSYHPSFKASNYLLYLGRLSREKGLLTLIKSMEDIDAAQLYIAGDGPLRRDLEAFVVEKKMKNVRFLGHLSGKKLAKAVRYTSFVVVASEWYENCPMSVLESFAYGKPVLGARIGGIPELIDDGVDGLVFESGNVDDLRIKIKYLLGNQDKLLEMGKNARKKVEEKFNADLYYERLMGVYKKALNRPSEERSNYGFLEQNKNL